MYPNTLAQLELGIHIRYTDVIQGLVLLIIPWPELRETSDRGQRQLGGRVHATPA